MVANATMQDKLPNWVNNPGDKYAESMYLTGLGSSSNKNDAENDALKSIAKFFQSRITVDESVNKQTQELDAGDNSAFSKSMNIIKQVNVQSNVNLINTRIAENYYDQKNGKFFVLAVMEKASTATILEKQMADNATLAADWKSQLTTETTAANRLQTALRIQTLFKANRSIRSMYELLTPTPVADQFGMSESEVTKLLDDAKAAFPVFMKSGEDVPSATVKVIESQFSKAGFRLTNTKPSDGLIAEVSYTGEETASPDGSMKFIMWNIGIRFKRADNQQQLSVYEKSGRSGQLTTSAAKKRAELTIRKTLEKELPAFIQSSIFK